MAIDKKIISEIKRYRSINQYLNEQDALPLADEPIPAAGDIPPAPGDVPPAPEAPAPAGPPAPVEPQVVDVETDDEVEKIDDSGESEEMGDEETGSEELEITDLVNSQKEIQTKQDDYFGQLFGQLEELTSKLSDMDKIVDKINQLEMKVEKYRNKTPEEKLELRSLDSYPFNQKLSDFFEDKEEDLEKTGKNEYILTSDEVENYSPSEIKKTFTPPADQQDLYKV
jgi:hypothetical protein